MRPESYYYGLLNELPKGATGLVIVAKVNTLLDDGRSFSRMSQIRLDLGMARWGVAAGTSRYPGGL